MYSHIIIRHVFILIGLVAFVLDNSVILAQEVESAKNNLPSKDRFKIVLLVGQSNMAGRGIIEDDDRRPIPRVYMLNQCGNWTPAIDPVHFDKPSAGVGLGREFARLLTESDPSIAVGLVPAACGGSSIDDWQPQVYFSPTKSYPFDDAIARTHRALEDGTLEAILWRQGESDATVDKAKDHEEKLFNLFERFRAEFHCPNVPILVGELALSRNNQGAEMIRNAQINVVKRLQPAAFVSAEGVTLNKDNIHFDRKSQIEQGKRFFESLQILKSSIASAKDE